MFIYTSFDAFNYFDCFMILVLFELNREIFTSKNANDPLDSFSMVKLIFMCLEFKKRKKPVKHGKEKSENCIYSHVFGFVVTVVYAGTV